VLFTNPDVLGTKMTSKIS